MRKLNLLLISIFTLSACSSYLSTQKKTINDQYITYEKAANISDNLENIFNEFWCKEQAKNHIASLNGTNIHDKEFAEYFATLPKKIKTKTNINSKDNCLLVSGYKKNNEAMSINLLYEQEDGKAKICHVHISIGKFDETPNCKRSED